MTTQEQVVALCCTCFNVAPAQCVMSARFVQDLGGDPGEINGFIMEMERAFDITIPPQDRPGITTVGVAVTYVDNALGN